MNSEENRDKISETSENEPSLSSNNPIKGLYGSRIGVYSIIIVQFLLGLYWLYHYVSDHQHICPFSYIPLWATSMIFYNAHRKKPPALLGAIGALAVGYGFWFWNYGLFEHTQNPMIYVMYTCSFIAITLTYYILPIPALKEKPRWPGLFEILMKVEKILVVLGVILSYIAWIGYIYLIIKDSANISSLWNMLTPILIISSLAGTYYILKPNAKNSQIFHLLGLTSLNFLILGNFLTYLVLHSLYYNEKNDNPLD